MGIILKNNYEYNKMTKTIFGTIFIDLNGNFFPCEDWTDFIYPVAYWWADELVKGILHNKQMELLFMDGSYCMHGSISEKNLKLLCYDNSAGEGQTIENGSFPTVDFINDLIKALSYCRDIFSDNGERNLYEECRKKIKILSELPTDQL